MNAPDADVDREAIMRTTAELLAAVNASDADRCLAVWSADGLLMPPHHPAVHGDEAILQLLSGPLFAKQIPIRIHVFFHRARRRLCVRVRDIHGRHLAGKRRLANRGRRKGPPRLPATAQRRLEDVA